MVDEIITDETNQKLGLFQTIMDSISNTIPKLGAEMSGLTDIFEKFGISTNVAQSFTESQQKQLGVLSAAVLGVKESYTSMSTEGVNLFRSFDSSIKEMVGEAGTGAGAIQKLAAAAKEKLNITVDASQFSSIGQLAAHLKQTGDNMVIQANNAIRLREGFLGLSAETGNFGKVIAMAGPQLENMNAIISTQATTISKTASATGLSTEEVTKFYEKIGKIPGALESTVSGLERGEDGMNMMTAAMKLAVGTGRSYDDVLTDLTTAFDNYGMSGESALTFTARISEISNNYGLKLKDVQSALSSTAQTFKGFANEGEAANKMAEGAADIFNRYIGALKSTGLTGNEAAATIQNMTAQIKTMDLATKSFLSAQTGGPGGLRGAFQIEKMLREGDIEGVFDKVRQQMEKQMGKIVTLDEASTSEAAAAQMTRQITMLRQGPLGQFARTDQEAMRILEGFKATQEGGAVTPELKETFLKDSIETGNKIQQQSYTEMDRLRNSVQEIQSSYLSPMLTLMQQGAAARKGAVSVDTTSQRTMRGELQRELTASSQRAAVATKTTKQMLDQEITPSDMSGSALFEGGRMFSRSLSGLFTTLTSSMDSAKSLLGLEGKSDQNDQIRKFKSDLQQDRAAANIPSNTILQAAMRSTDIQKTAEKEDKGEKPAVKAATASDYAPVELKVTAICKHCNQELESQHAQTLNTSNRR